MLVCVVNGFTATVVTLLVEFKSVRIDATALSLELTTWLLSRSCFPFAHMIKTASVVVSYKVYVDAVDSRTQTMSQVLVALAYIDRIIVGVELTDNSIGVRAETDLIRSHTRIA